VGDSIPLRGSAADHGEFATRRVDSRGEPATDREFDAFVRARVPSLLRLGYVLTGDQHLAEDLVQSALARTLLAWPRLHTSAEAYTRAAMYHLQVSWWRRPKIIESLPGELPESEAADNTANTAFRLTLQRALMRLTPRQRAVLILRYFEDRSEAEAAAVLNCSIGTVKSQTARALARLRTVAPELTELYREVRAS
jgi:RNA polymerase sigma-70 factor (sigma-E family)